MIRKHTKIALFTIAVLMVLAAAFTAVSAATAEQMTVSVSGVTLADVGKSYPISVDLFNNANNDINGVEIELRWDPACLKLSGDPKIGSGIPSSAVSQFSANTAKDGVLTFASASFMPMLKASANTQNLFAAYFEVLSGAQESNPIEVSIKSLGNSQNEYADKVFVIDGYIDATVSLPVLYVSDAGTGDGSSPNKPLGHGSAYNTSAPVYDTFKSSAFYRAMDALKATGGTIVIVGDTSVGYAPNAGTVGEKVPYKASGNWRTPTIAEGKTITITSVYDGIDYRTQGAEFVYDLTYNNPRMHFNGASIWENLTMKVLMDTSVVWSTSTNSTTGVTTTTSGSVPYIAFMGYKTVIGDGIQCVQFDKKTGTDPNTSNRYISLVAGSLWNTLRKSTDLTINSGTWYQAYGSTQFGGAKIISDQYGDVNLTINGGTFKSSVYATSTATNSGGDYYAQTCRVDGNINVTVNGGTFNTGLFMGKNGFINKDGVFTLKINGGTFYSTHAAAIWASGGSAWLDGTNKGTRIIDFSGMDQATYNTVAHSTNKGAVSLDGAFIKSGGQNGFDRVIPASTKTVDKLIVTKVGDAVYNAGDLFSRRGYDFAVRYTDGTYAEVGYGKITANKTKLTSSDTSVRLSYTFGGKTVSVDQPITVGKYLTGIALATSGKTTYNSGEIFDASGYTFKATYSDGSAKTVSGSAMTVPQTALKGSDNSIILTYTEGAVSKNIELPVKVTSSYSGLEVTQTGKTAYFKGENVDLSGYTFVARYADGSTKTVDSANVVVSPYKLDDLSLTKVTASCTMDGITHSVNLPVTVTMGLKSLEVKTYGQQNYEGNTYFNPEGYTFTVTYSDGTTATLNADQVTYSKDRLTAKDAGLVATYTLGKTKASTYIYLGTFPGEPYGDGKINSDDTIDIVDLLIVRRMQLGEGGYIAEDLELGDITGDDVIDEQDFNYLFNKILGKGVIAKWAKSLSVNPLGQYEIYAQLYGMSNNGAVYTIDSINGNPFTQSAVSTFDDNTFFYLCLNDATGTYAIRTMEKNGDDYFAEGTAKMNFTYGSDTFTLAGTVASATKGSLSGTFTVDSHTRYIVHNKTTGKTELAMGVPLNVEGNDPVITVRDDARVIIDIENNIVFVSDGTIDGVFLDYSEKSFDVLNGIGFDITGDSYVAGNGLDVNKTWSGLLSAKYGWDYGNYGKNGATVSVVNPRTGSTELYKHYKNMDGNADIVMVVAGRNDSTNYINGVTPIGTVYDTDHTTFLGALNIVYKGLKEMYPDALIMFGTLWETGQTNSVTGKPLTDFGEAMVEFCEYYDIPCFQSYDTILSGVDMRDTSFRAQYCQTLNDTSHLNELGMEMVRPNFERFIGVQYELFLAQK